ncbi:MAG: phosphate ABC transporter permease PstA, partial [Actinomycetota bacterium]
VTGFLATGSASLLEQLRSGFTALPVIIYAWASEPSPAFEDLNSAAVIVLLAFILTANGAAVLLRNRYDRKW